MTSPSSGTTPPPPEQSSKAYQPAAVEPVVLAKWAASGAFHADPARVLSGEKKPFCILIPPPNVTGALHLGHALNNTLQDVLTRAHRMMGFETLWIVGTDHAGIATQAVVERRLKKEQNKTRKDFTREQFIALVQEWKDEYEKRITGQLKAMGCSCDFGRQRFTMDEICARAVREAFFRLFKDGLIYRGKRLVNWDPALQTAVADDECYEEDVDTSFWYLRYPLVRGGSDGVTKGRSDGVKSGDFVPVTWDELARAGYPGAEQHPGDQAAWVTVATTRPETYLGDTAVAVSPHDHRAKALRGLHAELPLVGRVIPIVEDSYVVLPAAMARTEEEKNDPKAAFATGFLKVTPAHDENDNQLYTRHQAAIDGNSAGTGLINMMAPDGRVSDKHGWTDVGDAHLFVGLTMAEARKKVVAEFEARGLLEATKPYRQSKTFSDRSKAVIEPYLSDQWFMKVTDDRLAGAANRALVSEQRSGTGIKSQWMLVRREGYAHNHLAAFVAKALHDYFVDAGVAETEHGSTVELAGITIISDETAFRLGASSEQGAKVIERLDAFLKQRAGAASQSVEFPGKGKAGAFLQERFAGCVQGSDASFGDGSMRFYPARYAKTYEQWHDNIRDWCISRQLWWGHRIPVWHRKLVLKNGERHHPPTLNLGNLGYALDEEVTSLGLTGFAVDSSGEMLTREKRLALCRAELDGEFDVFLCITNPDYVSYFEIRGFTQDPDVLDTWFSSALWPLSTLGWPEPSQSAETKDLLAAFNPTTVLSTAREIITLWVSRMVMMNRYFMGEGQGRGQIPFHNVFIHAVVQDGEGRKMSKSLNNGVDPLDIIESHGADAMRFTLAQMTTQTQDVRMPVKKDSKTGKNSSEKFDAGRNFCNKLWNASRFAMAILQRAPGVSQGEGSGGDAGTDRTSRLRERLSLTDRWMLSRLAKAVRSCESSLKNYEFSDYCQTLYQLLWWDFCDWYLEAIKPTVDTDAGQRAVLRAALDVILRLLHPVAPFITETIHEQLKAHAGVAVAGITVRTGELLCTSSWPVIDASLVDEGAEKEFESLRELINAIRNVRAEHQVLPKRRITLHCSDAAAKRVAAAAPGLVENLAGLEAISTSKPAAGAPVVAFRAGGEEMHLTNLADAVDAGAEKERLVKQLEAQKKSEAALAGRLNNPGYADKAPAKLVEESRAQLAKIRAEIEAIEGKLKTM